MAWHYLDKIELILYLLGIAVCTVFLYLFLFEAQRNLFADLVFWSYFAGWFIIVFTYNRAIYLLLKEKIDLKTYVKVR